MIDSKRSARSVTPPDIAPERPLVGIAPKLSDAELITLAVMQALLGSTSEARWIHHARAHLTGMFPAVPAAKVVISLRAW